MEKVDLGLYKSEQEIYDAVTAGLAAQGWARAYREGTGCVYRTRGNKLACAGGQLLPDEVADTLDQDDNASQWWALIEAEVVSNDFAEFISACQSVHDANEEPIEMVRDFRNLAFERNLTIPPWVPDVGDDYDEL